MSLFINKEISLFQEEGYSPDKYFEPDVNSNILSPKFNFTRAPENKEERDKWVKVARENILDTAVKYNKNVRIMKSRNDAF